MRSLFNHIDGRGIRKDSVSHIEAVFLSTNWYSRNAARQLCQLCHFPNFARKYQIGDDASNLKTRIVFVDESVPEYDHNGAFWNLFWSSFGKLNKICKLTILDPDKESPIIVDPLSETTDNGWFDIEFVILKCRNDSRFFLSYIAERKGKNALVTQIDLTDERGVMSNLSEVLHSTADFGRVIFEMSNNLHSWSHLSPQEFDTYLIMALAWEYRLRAMGININRPHLHKLRRILESDKEIYGIVEHNRWVTESVLSGYSPLDVEDFSFLEKSPDSLSLKKEILKKSKKHLNICSFRRLSEIDPLSIPEYYQRNNQILEALKRYKKYKVSHIPELFEQIKSYSNNILKFGLTLLLTVLTFFGVNVSKCIESDTFLHIEFFEPIENTLICLFCTFAGWFGIISIVNLIRYLYYDRIRFDKTIAEIGGRSIAYLMCFIICFPCSLALIAQIWVEPYDMIYDRQLFQHSHIEHVNHLEQEIAEKSQDPNIFWTFFYHFTDPGNQHMTGTPKGRVIALFVGFLGSVFLTGLLVSSLISYWENWKEKWSKGEIFYKFKSPYVIVLGDSQLVPSVIRQALKRTPEVKYFVVMTIHSIPEIRQQYMSELGDTIDQIVFYHGNYSSELDISKLNVWSPFLKSIYIIGEEENKKYIEANDTKNIKSVHLILKERQIKHEKAFPTLLPCYAMFEDQTSYSSFIYSDISNEMKRYLLFTPFNRNELWAQKIFLNGEGVNNGEDMFFKPLDFKNGRGIEAHSENHVHLVIEGMTPMGLALAREAALNCHYLNFAEQEWREELDLERGRIDIKSSKDALRTRITFIDNDMQNCMSRFINRHRELFEISKWRFVESGREVQNTIWNDNVNAVKFSKVNGYCYRHLTQDELLDSNFLDVEWEFLEGSLSDRNIVDYLKNTCCDDKEFLTIAICQYGDGENIELAVNLPQKIMDQSIQILVLQHIDCNIT